MLTDIPTTELEAAVTQFEQRLAAANPDAIAVRLGRFRLNTWSLGNLASSGALDGLSLAGGLAAVKAALAERTRRPAEAELVWSGPAGREASAQSTRSVVRDLLGSAKKSVWMCGYRIEHGKELFAPLLDAMNAHGVTVNLLLNLKRDEPVQSGDQESSRKETVHAQAHLLIEKFFHDHWPTPSPRPTIYYDPRMLYDVDDPKQNEAEPVRTTMQARVVVVDEEDVLIGSGNLTNRSQTRNIEAGALLHNPAFAVQLVTQIKSLIDGDHIWRYGDPDPHRAAAGRFYSRPKRTATLASMQARTASPSSSRDPMSSIKVAMAEPEPDPDAPTEPQTDVALASEEISARSETISVPPVDPDEATKLAANAGDVETGPSASE